MKEYNCPDCKVTGDSCRECQRAADKFISNDPNKQPVKTVHVPPYFPDSITWPNDIKGIPDCCKNCTNHPSNNGGKIVTCNCVLPYQTHTAVKINSIGDSYYLTY